MISNGMFSGSTSSVLLGKCVEGAHWEGPVRSEDVTCGKTEHTHTDDCYIIFS